MLPHRVVTIELGSRSYGVVIGAELLGTLGALVAELAVPRRAVALVFDANLPASIVEQAAHSLRSAGFGLTAIPVVGDESHKTLDGLREVLIAMENARIERGDPVIALGGGVVGDLAGFAAAIYRRGTALVQCPTTLLAMVDASVGGKTGINLSLGDGGPTLKNAVGAFHQPLRVVADVSVLASLPDRHFRCGLAECVKHGLLGADLGDAGLLDTIEDSLDRVLAREPATLIAIIARNISVKAAAVGSDEREERPSGGRALLNLGHTFGHAIEPIVTLSPDGDPAHAPLQHGEAVGLGLVAACRTSEAMGRAPASLGDRVESLLRRCGLPTLVAGLPSTAEILAAMAHDKKARDGRLRLVLPVATGRAEVVADPPREAVVRGLDAIRSA
ncbi:MAG: 3-dehydroquinate synthase family protein [Phycisphaerales bacterium]